MATGVPPFTFWEHQTVLWNTSMGDPRDPNNATLSNMSSSTRSSYSSTSSKYDAKLSGFYNWPFSITLPTTCRFSPKKKAPEVEMPLPPSFSEKGAAQYVNYEINVKIGRGQWRIDNKWVITMLLLCRCVYTILCAQLRFQDWNTIRIYAPYPTHSSIPTSTSRVPVKQSYTWPIRRPRWLENFPPNTNPRNSFRH